MPHDSRPEFIPKLFSLEYASPSEVLGLHEVFDLTTHALLSRGVEPDLVRVLAAAFSLFSLSAPGLTRVSRELAPSSHQRLACSDLLLALTVDGSGQSRDSLLALWNERARLSRIVFSWDHVLEGHPMLGGLPSDEIDDELRRLGARVLEVARHATAVTHDIDERIAAMYGAQCGRDGHLRVGRFRYHELAAREPAAIRMSSLYSAEDFRSAEASRNSASTTKAPRTKGPRTQAPGSKAPRTLAPGGKAPGGKAPRTKAPKAAASRTKAPRTKAPKAAASRTKAPR
jgi:hypothetical protein